MKRKLVKTKKIEKSNPYSVNPKITKLALDNPHFLSQIIPKLDYDVNDIGIVFTGEDAKNFLHFFCDDDKK